MELSQLIINQETFSIRALVETHRRVKRVAPCYPMSMDDFYGQDLAFVHAEAFEALAVSAAETLLQFLGRGAPSRRVLDLGCGAGPLSRRLSEKGFSTWGLDLSPALIAVARERLPGAEFQCGSIHDARLPKAAAAAAVGEVLNYATAHDPAALSGVFARVFKALAPGGVFLFDLAGPGRVGAGRSFTEGRTGPLDSSRRKAATSCCGRSVLFVRLTRGCGADRTRNIGCVCGRPPASWSV